MGKAASRSFTYATLLASVLASTTAKADFSFEVTGGYSDIDSRFTEQELYNASFSWFIAPVDESKGPLAEAAFLSRSSSFRYSYSRVENSSSFQRFGPSPGVGIAPIIGGGNPTTGLVEPAIPDPKTHSLETRYVVADTPWVVGSRFSITDGDSSQGNLSNDQDDWSGALSLGRYVLTNTTLTLRGEYTERKSSTDSSVSLSFPTFGIDQLAEFSTELETESFDIALIGKHVGTVGDYSYELSANLGYLTSDTDIDSLTLVTDVATGEIITTTGGNSSRTSFNNLDSWRAGLSASWYFTNRLSLQASYQFNEFESQNTNGFGVGLNWFVTRTLEVRGNYGRSNVDGPFNDLEQWGISLRGRF